MIIGGFWLLDSLKDPIFATVVGIEYQPLAKLLSVVFTLFVVCIYDNLTSCVSKPALFYIVGGSYGTLFLIISGCLPNYNSKDSQEESHYYPVVGWMSFFIIESYGSLMVAMFWSFTNSIMDLEQAKGGYGLILSFAQVGAIGGSTLAANVDSIGYPFMFLIGAICAFSVTLLMKLYHIVFLDELTIASKERVRTYTEEDIIPNEKLAPEARAPKPDSRFAFWIDFFTRVFAGFWEGLSLIYQHKYVMRILAVSCFYEIIVTVLDYEFKILGAGSLEPSHASDKNATDSFKFAVLMGQFG